MTAMPTRLVGAGIGVVAMVLAGALAGSWWWVVALVGAASAVGAVVDRHLVFVQMLVVLALGVGLSSAAALWAVPLLVGGTFASTELGAAADGTTIIRPRVTARAALATSTLRAVAVCALVLVVGQLPAVAAAGPVVIAAAAAVVATRVIAR